MHAGSSTFPDRFGRTIDLYGAAGFARIRAAQATVVGLGGVGSHAAMALARSGIGELHLIDPDRITATSLNRFLAAGPEEVGRPKVEVLAEAFARTCPDTRVRTTIVLLEPETQAGLLDPAPDLVIDAIDSLEAKTALILYCHRQGVPIVASMGAAGRRDGSQVRIDDISATRGCALARRVRRLLRQAGVEQGVTCVYSAEPVVGSLPPDEGEPTGRVRRRLPSSIAVPGITGYMLASAGLDLLVETKGDRE